MIAQEEKPMPPGRGPDDIGRVKGMVAFFEFCRDGCNKGQHGLGSATLSSAIFSQVGIHFSLGI
jgi:hypothetical protein